MVVIENISKSFDEKTVISGFSHIFSKGSVTSIFGDSGSGKTTLLRIIAGLEMPDTGTVRNDGVVSMVFQEPRLLMWKSVIDNVMISGCDRARAQCLLDRLGIGTETDSLVSELSGGMAQRVSIARALGAPFDILLLDEPFTGLDENTAFLAADFIKENLKPTDTVILVTHNRALAEYMSDNMIYSEDLVKE